MNSCNCPTESAPAKEQNESAIRPQFRITQNDDGTTVHVALPGVLKDDLKLTLLESSLRVEATRNSGSLRRYRLDLRLTSRLDGTTTTAALDAGVLTLQVPIREEAKPRQIQVN